MYIPTFVLMFDSPVQIALVVGVIMLVFGAGKIPQLAKSLGQAQKSFKDGLREGEEDETPQITSAPAPAQISNLSDDEILAEMQRRNASKSA